jgi:hypothetical protein
VKPKNREAEIAKKSVERVQLYQRVFGTPEGRRVLMDMANAHSIMRSTFDGDVHKMLLHEGERNVILRLLKLAKVNVNDLIERIEDYERESI